MRSVYAVRHHTQASHSLRSHTPNLYALESFNDDGDDTMRLKRWVKMRLISSRGRIDVVDTIERSQSNKRNYSNNCVLPPLQFKRRNHLSSHRRSLKYVSQSALDPIEQEHTILTYVHEARDAIDKYGARNTLNMDETPVPKCEHPITGIVETNSGRAAECKTDAGNRLNVTHFPCISASGKKLQMCAIIKGKTPRTLKKIVVGASPAVSRVRLYYSQSGWINAGIVIRWLEDVRPGGTLINSTFILAAACFTSSVQCA